MSDLERIAVLEAHQANLRDDIKELMIQIKDMNEFIRAHMKEEEKRWTEIHEVISKWKGVLGGMFMVTSAIWAIFIFAADWIQKWMHH